MAHEPRRSSNFVEYYQIRDGQFYKKYNEPTIGAIERTNKNGKKVWEEFFDFDLSGVIKRIKLSANEWAGQILENVEIVIQDIDETYSIQLDLNSRYAQSFFARLPNIDLDKRVILSPAKYQKDGKDIIGLFVKQDGESVKSFYTKDEPNGMPQLIPVQVNGKPFIKDGKQVWDSSEREAFIKAGFQKYSDLLENKQPDLLENVNVPASTSDQGTEDDLPF